MKKYFLVFLVLLLSMTNLSAQGFRERYESFRKQTVLNYKNFREACNNQYIEFLLESWKLVNAQEAVAPPKEDWLPPVEMSEDENMPLVDREIPSEPIRNPKPDTLRPLPVEPIEPSPVMQEILSFDFLNTPMQVHVGRDLRFIIPTLDEKGVAETWRILSNPNFDNLILDCLFLRDEYKLCDWAYLLMLYSLSYEFLGEGNEAMLLTAYLYSQSGYQMRLGITDSELSLLVATDYLVYGRPYFSIDDVNYWALNGGAQSMRVVGHDFPGGKPLSLEIPEVPHLAWNASEPKLLRGSYSLVTASCQLNLNLLAFYDLYPNAQYGDNAMTRWAMYANAPMDPEVKAQLYPSLERAMIGKTLPEAANLLLDFVQRAFQYEYDDKMWGGDRALFAEETLFYPFSDCEDRSILYSRLVRDLLGLEVALVYYPGHLATAVKFPFHVSGDYVMIDSQPFLVCDPTYIGAPIGKSMPDLDKQAAKVIVLR